MVLVPFSGIRINTAVTRALSVAHDIPCVGVSSLQAIAQAAYQKYGVTEVYSALDARMQQVCWAICADRRPYAGGSQNGEDTEQIARL